MHYQVEDITAYDNVHGAGILAKVRFLYEDHSKSIIVHVHIPLDKEASLAEVESRILNAAKDQLRELTSSF